MSNSLLMILLVLITGIISGFVGFGIKLFLDQRSQIASKNAANQQINMAQERSQEILLEAKEKSLQFRLESEKENTIRKGHGNKSRLIVKRID